MFRKTHAKPWLIKLILPPLGLAFVPLADALAQDGEFADDFQLDSVSYSSFRFDDSVGESSAMGVPGGIALSASSDGSGFANRLLRVSQRSESLAVEMQFEQATLDLNDGAYAYLDVQGHTFNVIADGGPDNGESSEGDVFVNVNVGIDGAGNSQAGFCLSRSNGEFDEPYPLLEDGSNNCHQFENVAVQPGQTFSLGYALDSSNATLHLHVNDAEMTLNLPDTPYTSRNSFLGVNMGQENGAGGATATISRITTDNGSDDFSSGIPVIDRYLDVPRLDDTYRNVSVDDGKVRMVVQSGRYPGQDDDNVYLFPQVPTDHFEALVTLESETDIGDFGMRAVASIQAVLYNELADGGTDGSFGDVRAELELAADANGMRRVEYCLRRFDDAQGDSRTNLLPNNRSCIAMPASFQIGDSHRLAISLDREAATVTFRMDGHSVVVPIATAMHTAADPTSQLVVESRNGARAVASIDELRTSPDALTQEEIESGLTTPPAFPEPAEEIVADSSIDFPFEPFAEVSFTDDFSSDTSLFGIDIWPRGSDAGLALVDGALELQSHAESADQSASAALEVQDETDFIRATASISERTSLTPGENEASFDLEAVFHNDTIDGGLDNRQGDIQTKIRLRAMGTGEWRVAAEINRRNAEGNLESPQEIFGEDGYHIFELTPAFDTPIDLSIELDRENRVMKFMADEQVHEVALPGELYLPAQRRLQFRAWHGNANSGRAVVRIHALQTENLDLDFSEDHPTMAPYRPNWESFAPGRSVTVEDGRLVLRADSEFDGNDPRVVVQGRSDYLAADLELSSTSRIVDGRGVLVDVSGVFYNDHAADQDPANEEGIVFAALRLVSKANETPFAEACAFRSNDADFDSVSELIGGDADNCPRFSTAVALDASYPASIELDQESATLTFTLADEQMVYTIPTAIHQPSYTFNGARARAQDGSAVVAYVDNLAFAATTELLSDSPDQLLGVPPRPSSSGGGNTGIMMLLLLLSGLLYRRNGRMAL